MARQIGVQVDQARLQRLAAGEGQQPARQVGAARALSQISSASARLRDRRAAIDQELGVADDRHQQLLKSCAMPPVSWPIASIFCAWRSSASPASRG